MQWFANSRHISIEWKEPLGYGGEPDDKFGETRPPSRRRYPFFGEETAANLQRNSDGWNAATGGEQHEREHVTPNKWPEYGTLGGHGRKFSLPTAGTSKTAGIDQESS